MTRDEIIAEVLDLVGSMHEDDCISHGRFTPIGSCSCRFDILKDDILDHFQMSDPRSKVSS
jgi:hypothetical protein